MNIVTFVYSFIVRGILLSAVILLSQIGFAQQVHTYVDADSVQVGEVFTYTIVFEGQYSSITYPGEDSFNEPSELEFISRDRFQVTETRDSLNYRLQYFGTENFSIPRKEIRITDSDSDTTVYTTPVPIFFKSTLAEDDEEFRPLKPIFDFARVWWPWLLFLLILGIAAYYIFVWVKKQEKKPRPEPKPAPEPFHSPLVELRDSIQSLPDPATLATHEDFENYYIRLGDSIRKYLKSVYNITALEMTTREIDLALKEELASEEIINITKKVLNEADMVKFANFRPTEEMARSVLQKATQFIDTARIVNREQIHYLKYRYEVEHGIVKESEIKESKEKQNKHELG